MKPSTRNTPVHGQPKLTPVDDSDPDSPATDPGDAPEPPANPKSDLDAVAELADAHKQIVTEIEKRIIGQRRVVDQLLVALFARGHTLFVGVPGLAKTLLISTLAETLNLSFQRIQFTPDLMPSDITGTEVLEEDHTTGRRVFRFIKGPVFANLVPRRRDQPHAAQDPGRGCSSRCRSTRSPPAATRTTCRCRSSCSRRRTRSSRRARTRCPRRSSTASCSRSTSTTRARIRRGGDRPPADERSPPRAQARALTAADPPAAGARASRPRAADHVVKYAVALARATRPTSPNAPAVREATACRGAPAHVHRSS